MGEGSQKITYGIPGSAVGNAARHAGRMHTTLGRLAWLLEFARHPIDLGMSKRELADLQGQILAFCLGQAGAHFESGRISRLTPGMIRKLQDQVGSGINSFVRDPRVGWRLPQVSQRLLRDPSGYGRFVRWGDPEQLFPHFAAALLALEGARIKSCARPGCGNLLVRRKRGAYCSMRCSQYVRTRRYRERHPIDEAKKARAADSRHRRYEGRINAKPGRNIKVRRMRRRK